MKLLTIMIALLLLAAGTTQAQEFRTPSGVPGEVTPLIPGTDSPRSEQCGTDTVYGYNTYTIYAAPSGGEVGENIYIYKPANGGDLCKTTEGKAEHLFDNETMGGANFFAGLYKDYIFIDQGSGPDYRMLSVYDLQNKKLVLSTIYSDPAVSNGTLSYYETINPHEIERAKVPCPKASYWKLQGLSIIYQKQMTFDLATKKKESVGTLRCVSGQ